ncbi:lanthionine synthetase C family protein [Nucisporomicrobium flavum]|uniref:lanthionine synthetase C family protein n=1 Tax=Nucisporomicrobium flavum TaxID=2785915 RepID=UPI0018F6F277|nr:lanthionine synthetase C family protein [Nucisporomicrobium flavum]
MTAIPAGQTQSLGAGTAGHALLAVERAHRQMAAWRDVHRLAQTMTGHPLAAHPDTGGLFHGATAVAFTLHTAGHPAYADALATLDQAINTMIRRRLTAAHRRIDAQRLPQAGEYDLISGITGLGVYLLHRHGDHPLLRDCLTYLVRLTEPLHIDGEHVPGWWAAGSPDRHAHPRWSAGHAGFGIAHGVAGPLALLSAAMQRAVTVDGHAAAITHLCAWLDQWRTGSGRDAWWPEVIGRDEWRTRQPDQGAPMRPSWCYGTPGIARAQHLAGLATADPGRVHTAEQALLGCATDQRQLAHLDSPGLCHGAAGLAHTLGCAATDTGNPELRTAAAAVLARARQQHPGTDGGLLEGVTGVLLTTIAGDVPQPAVSGWDTCLLVRGSTAQPPIRETTT